MKKIFKTLFVFAALAATLAGFLTGAGAPAAAAGGAVSWGLSYSGAEKTPRPPESGVRLLSENNGIFVAATGEKKVWFTFDLGYEAGYTAEVLDTLKEYNIKAVFFLCGNYLKETALISRMIDEGHSAGNHTDRHKDLPALSDAGIQKEIGDFQNKFAEKYSAPIVFFRPPQGRFCERTLKEANAQGLKTLMWSIAIADWGKSPINAETNAQKISSRIHPGAIILLHITNAGTPKMLRLLLSMINEKGYQIGNPSEL